MSEVSSQTLQIVNRELAATLNEARVALEQFAEQPDGVGALERCAEHLRQTHGVLRLVEVHGAALLAEEMEQVVRHLITGALENRSQAESLDALMRAMVQLPTYLERVLSGGRDLALILLPLLNDLRAVRGHALLSEGTLLLLNLKSDKQAAPPSPLPPGEAEVPVVQWARRLRTRFQMGLLGWIRGERTDQNLDVLRQVAEKLEQVATTQPVFQLWWVTGAVLEALRDKGLVEGATLKRLLGLADREMKRLYLIGEARYSENPPIDLLNNLLYYIARAASSGPRVSAVRASFRLGELLPVDDAVEQARAQLSAPSIKLMRTVGDAIKEDLSKVKDVLDIFVRKGGTQTEELAPQLELLKKISDTLGVLGLGDLRERVQAEIRQLQTLLSGSGPVSDAALVQMAATLINVEDSLDTQLIGLVMHEDPNAPPAEAEKTDTEFVQVAAAVLRECIVNLARVKETIVQAVQKPNEAQGLDALPQLLRGITAGLLMLGKTRAVEVTEQVAQSIQAMVGPGGSMTTHALDRLADAIVSIEYYMETLQAGRNDPWYMLDNAESCLKALADLQAAMSVSGEDRPARTSEAAGYDHTVVLGDRGPAAGGPAAAADALARAGLDSTEATATATATQVERQAATHAVPQAPGLPQNKPDIDPEFLALFIEEAKEVIASIDNQFPLWEGNPADTESLSSLRRSFHTLKGSGRMVGAQRVGEFSWAIENLLNRVIDKTLARTPGMMGLLREAVNVLPSLVVQLESGSGSSGSEPQADVARIVERLHACAQNRPPSHAEATASGQPKAAAADDSSVLTDSTRLTRRIEPQADTPAPAPVPAVEPVLSQVAIDPVLHDIYTRESAGHLATLRDFLVRSESLPPPVALPEAVYRACHTLSGSSQMAEARHGIRVAEPLNQYVRKVFENQAGLSREGLEVLALSVDAIEDSIANINESTGYFVRHDALVERIHRLEAALEEELAIRQLEQSAPMPPVPQREQMPPLASLPPEPDAPELFKTELSEPEPEPEPEHEHEHEHESESESESEYEHEHERKRAPEPSEAERFEAELSEPSVAEAQPAAVFAEPILESEPKFEPPAVDPFPEPELFGFAEEEEAEQGPVSTFVPREVVAAADEDAADFDVADFDPEIAAIFTEEAAELLEAADRSLTAWNGSRGDKEQIFELKRQLHTLKGGARMAGIRAMGDLSHELETLVECIESGAIAASDSVYDILQASLDELGQMRDAVNAGRTVAPADRLVQRIRDLVSPPAQAAPAPTPLEVAAPEVAVSDRLELEETLPESAAFESEAEAESAFEAEPEPEPASAYASGSGPESGSESESESESGSETEPAPRTPLLQAAGKFADVFVPRGREVQGAQDGQDAQDRQSTQDAGGQLPRRSFALPPGREPQPVSERQEMARVDAELLDTLLNNAGEVSIFRSRLEQQVGSIDFNLAELTRTVTRLKEQLRKLEIETEAQILNRHEKESPRREDFDPLELDRYSAIQQFSRALAESASDVGSIENLLETLTREAQNLLMQQARVITELQNGLMRTRMVPFQRHVQRLSRIVRQVATETGKRAEMTVAGASGELDRQVLERMMPPFEHMLRNAVVHGIEAPAERAAKGKPETGRIAVSLHREGAEVVIVVQDDGAGMNVKAIRDKASSMGLIDPRQTLTDEEAMQLILEPGFSTAGSLTQAAGRGVGMDVVATEVKKLGGALLIESTPGVGTTFTIRLPFTLAISQALIVRVIDELYALPLPTVEGVVRVPKSEIVKHLQEESPPFEYGGQHYRFQHLGAFLGSGPSALPEHDTTAHAVILIRAGEHSTGLIADELVGSREIVVKSVGPQISGIRGISGATILGDGRIVIILDAGALVRSEWRTRTLQVDPRDREDKRTFALVVDDSITVRRVTQRLLERNGMRVITAKDGVDALSVLQEHLPDVILLDIEMPRMDGYEVASHVRNDARLKDVPIVMITSRVGDKHRARAIELGVNDYLGKPYQEAQLLDAIEPLVHKRRQQSAAQTP